MSGRRVAPGWLTVGMDVMSLLFAWVIVFKQAGILFPAPEDISEPLLLFAGALIGVPGVKQILTFRFGGGGEGRGIGGVPLPPPVPVSPAGPSRSEPSLGGDR